MSFRASNVNHPFKIRVLLVLLPKAINYIFPKNGSGFDIRQLLIVA